MKNGDIYYIDFRGNIGFEINKIHLGIIFEIPNVKNLYYCIPLTSPKEKHFKTVDDFNNRNYLNMSFPNYEYIKDTDSIVLLDQIKSISKYRLIRKYNKKLSKKAIDVISIKVNKYLINIIKNNKEEIKKEKDKKT